MIRKLIMLARCEAKSWSNFIYDKLCEELIKKRKILKHCKCWKFKWKSTRGDVVSTLAYPVLALLVGKFPLDCSASRVHHKTELEASIRMPFKNGAV